MPSLLRKVQDARKKVPGSLSLVFFNDMLEKMNIVYLRFNIGFRKYSIFFSEKKLNLNSLLLCFFVLFYQVRISSAETLTLQNKPIEFQRRQNPDPAEQKKMLEKKMKEVSDLYEKQFLGEMVKAMRSTVSYSTYTQPTMAEQIYRDKMYEEYVQNWSNQGGVGFSKVIYQQLLERYSPYHRKINDTPSGPRPLQSKVSLELNDNSNVDLKSKKQEFKKIEEQ